MTYTKKQVLPALHNSNKIKNPDMPDIEDRNYTSTILKYGNLALPFSQLHTTPKTIVAAINHLYDNRVVANPPSSGSAAPLTSIKIDGDIYTIDGGGTTVVANPSEDPDDELYSLKVGDTVYSVPDFTQSTTVYLYPNNWDSSTLRQTVDVPDIHSSTTLLISPVAAPSTGDNFDVYIQCGIRAITHGSGKVTFECKTIPTKSLTVGIVYWG